MKFNSTHIFTGISLADYEHLYFDETFNIAMSKAVRLSRDLQKREEKNGRLERVVKVGPDREIPKPLAKIIGSDRIEYTEHINYAFGSYLIKWYTVSSILTDKVDTHGTVKLEAAATGVRRTVDGEINVKIFGVGKMVEKFIVSDIEKSYDDAARFTQRWIDSGGKA